MIGITFPVLTDYQEKCLIAGQGAILREMQEAGIPIPHLKTKNFGGETIRTILWGGEHLESFSIADVIEKGRNILETEVIE